MEIRLIAIALSVALWIISQYVGHSVGMDSSAPIEKGNREDVYLDRVQNTAALSLSAHYCVLYAN